MQARHWRVILTLTVSALIRCPLPAAEPDLPPLFYAVISDTQKPDGDELKDFLWAVGQVNELAPAFVLVPGDLTNTGTDAQYENFMRVASILKPPVYVAVGNHEAPCGEEIYRSRFTRHTGQQPYYHRQLGGWHLFVLDSVRFKDGKLMHDGEIDADQMAWLRAELAKVDPAAPVFLSLHHPLIQRDGLINYPELLGAFAGHNLLYTVTAHFHRNRHHQDANAIHHFVTGALSFSCSKDCGIGYRLISTVGRDLWTAWIETTDAKPLALVHRAQGPWRGEMQADPGLPEGLAGPLCVRLTYRGQGVVLRLRRSALGEKPAARAVPSTNQPPAPETIEVDDEGNTVRLRLPPADEPATAFVPLPRTRSSGGARKIESLSLSVPDGASVEDFRIYETSARWEQYRLKRPGETKCEVTLHHPRPDSRVARGTVPVLATIRGRPDGLTPQLIIDGRLVIPAAGDYVAALFDVNGLQGKGYGFKNSLYANGEFIALLPMDRDITEWEKLAYPLPRSAWEGAEEEPWFMITAGTPTDGTGANPAENNEDYLTRNVALFDGSGYLRDQALPPARIRLVGDNRPDAETFFRCRPSVSFEPSDWQALLHAWNTVDLAPGEHSVTVRIGGAAASVTVTVE